MHLVIIIYIPTYLAPPMDYHFDGVGGLACCDDGLGHGGGVVFFFHPGRFNHAAKASPELPD